MDIVRVLEITAMVVAAASAVLIPVAAMTKNTADDKASGVLLMVKKALNILALNWNK